MPPTYRMHLPLAVGAALLAAAGPAPARALESGVAFSSSSYVDGGPLSWARPGAPARGATATIYPFGPVAPRTGYTGPAFLLGYEVKAREPSDLTIAADRMVLENDLANGPRRQDAISLVALGDWPTENTYQVAVAVAFPVQPFRLESLSYAALNWTKNESYNERLRHRWLVATGGKYYVNAHFLGRTGKADDTGALARISAARSSGLVDRWVPYDPTVSLFADLTGPASPLGPALDQVTAVGLYMDAVDFRGAGPNQRQWKFTLLEFFAAGVGGS